MKHVFPKALLTFTPDDVYHKRWLNVVNVGLEIIANRKAKNPKVANPALNGKYDIQGVFDYIGIANQSPLNAGRVVTLKVSGDGKFALLPVLLLECLQINTPSPHRRCYTWYFGGLAKPVGLIETDDGEISIDDLLEDLGATRDMLGKVKFDSEGGFQELC
jgi:hypothetical protein